MGELIGLPFCIATGIVWVFSIVCVGFYSFDEILRFALRGILHRRIISRIIGVCHLAIFFEFDVRRSS